VRSALPGDRPRPEDVSLRSWTKLDRLQDSRSFPAWIRRIAANAARDHLRRLSVRREEALDNALNLESDDDPHIQAERVAELRLMLSALEEEDEETVQLLMARANGVGVEELASSLGLSQGALKMRLLRVRQRLKRRLQELRDRGPTHAS